MTLTRPTAVAALTVTATAFATSLVASAGPTAQAGAPDPPPDEIAVVTAPPITIPPVIGIAPPPPIEVIHVETDTQFGSMTEQGTVLLAETIAPTASSEPGWWLRVDLQMRNNGDQPVTVSSYGLTTDVSPIDIEPIDEPVEIAPDSVKLSKPHTLTGEGTPPSTVTFNIYADGFDAPAQATYELGVYEDATATNGYRFPSRADDLPNGVFWTPGSFHAHARSQRYAYDFKAVRWDTSLGKWTSKTEQAYVDDANGIPLGSINEHALIWGLPVRAMADGVIVKCVRTQPDHPPGGEFSVSGANKILIDHGNGEYAAYAHFMDSSIPAELCPAEHPIVGGPNPDHVPVPVKAGDFLGRVGNSGPSTGPHMHIHLVDADHTVPKSNVRGLPLNFHSVFARQYTGFDPTTDDADWNWVTTHETAAIGYKTLIHPNSCGWDTDDRVIDDFKIRGGSTEPDPIDDFALAEGCDRVPNIVFYDFVPPTGTIDPPTPIRPLPPKRIVPATDEVDSQPLSAGRPGPFSRLMWR